MRRLDPSMSALDIAGDVIVEVKNDPHILALFTCWVKPRHDCGIRGSADYNSKRLPKEAVPDADDSGRTEEVAHLRLAHAPMNLLSRWARKLCDSSVGCATERR
jgi:hypothetical protein